MAVLNIPSEQLFLSKEEFCRVCHIGKQTALHLIETGVVQAIDTKKKTNRYLIPRASVEQYLSDRIEHPERYGNPTRTYGTYRIEVGNRMRELLDERMKDAEDLLDAEYVANLIGYLAMGYDKETIEQFSGRAPFFRWVFRLSEKTTPMSFMCK